MWLRNYKFNNVIQVSLLLTLNRFHTLFRCFYFSLCASKCRLDITNPKQFRPVLPSLKNFLPIFDFKMIFKLFQKRTTLYSFKDSMLIYLFLTRNLFIFIKYSFTMILPVHLFGMKITKSTEGGLWHGGNTNDIYESLGIKFPSKFFKT